VLRAEEEGLHPVLVEALLSTLLEALADFLRTTAVLVLVSSQVRAGFNQMS
jgi:hypothetical protein